MRLRLNRDRGPVREGIERIPDRCVLNGNRAESHLGAEGRDEALDLEAHLCTLCCPLPGVYFELGA